MKHRILLLALTIVSAFASKAQSTIFSENFGTPTQTAGVWPSVSTFTGYQNYGSLTFTGNADARTTTPSSYSGASASGNIFLTNTVGTNITISNINTLGYTAITMSLGIYKSTLASNGSDLKIQISTNGTTWTNLTYTLPMGAGTAIWRLVSPTGTIPSVSNLRIRVIMNTTSPGLQFRIDDLVLKGSPDLPLPLEMGDFTVASQDNSNTLRWFTYSEWDLDKFTVMKSLNGIDWIEVGSVKANGNSTMTSYYLLTDDIEGKINYYKLLMIDIDGATRQSKIIAIMNKLPNVYVAPSYYNILGQEVNQGASFIIVPSH